MAFRLPLAAKRLPDYLQVPMPLGVQEQPGITRAESTDKKHGYLWCLEWHLNRQPPHLTLGRRRGRPLSSCWAWRGQEGRRVERARRRRSAPLSLPPAPEGDTASPPSRSLTTRGWTRNRWRETRGRGRRPAPRSRPSRPDWPPRRRPWTHKSLPRPR